MLAVGGFHDRRTGRKRMPWVDLPRCQSCHTGDELDHKGGKVILRRAYRFSDPAATPRAARNTRFAENDGKLFRFSLGHGGMTCLSCHGSPHAEWAVKPAKANDNRQSRQVQGHTRSIIECDVCREDPQRWLRLNTNGPHDLHNINSPQWYLGHFDFVLRGEDECLACHGQTGDGTALSRAAAKLTLLDSNFNTVEVPRRTAIGCTLCHAVSSL